MKVYGFRIGHTGLEFSSREDRDKAMLVFTRASTVNIHVEPGPVYSDGADTFGFVAGAIQGIVVAAGYPHTLVQPKKWQKEIYQGIPEIRKPPVMIKKGKMAGQMKKGNLDTKAMSLLAAKRLFPTLDLRASERCKKAHDGIVDALLIAEYGARQYAGMR